YGEGPFRHGSRSPGRRLRCTTLAGRDRATSTRNPRLQRQGRRKGPFPDRDNWIWTSGRPDRPHRDLGAAVDVGRSIGRLDDRALAATRRWPRKGYVRVSFLSTSQSPAWAPSRSKPLCRLHCRCLRGRQAGRSQPLQSLCDADTTIPLRGEAGLVAKVFAPGAGQYPFLVRHLKAQTGLKVELHCHNDFGLSVANVLAGYEAGADVLQVSVNGVGYRAGNASLESVVMALEVLYGVDTGLRLDLLYDTCRMVEQMTGLANGYFKPIVGDGAFRFEQWAMADRFTRAGERRYAFPFEPEVVGRVPELVVGKWSDKQAVIQKLAEYGLSASAEQIERIQHRSQRLGAAKGRPLHDDEFLAVADAIGVTEL
ncbi:MAG: hypothetical protein EOP19_21170, partial [Hyphomicrobiales bacterium]